MQNSSLHFRVATATDNILLADLSRQTFAQAFAKDNTPEDMAAYLPVAFSPAIQAAELAEPENIFWIISRAEEVVGYVKLSMGPTDACISKPKALKLVRFYVLQTFWGQGIGHETLNRIINFARENTFEAIWLGVWSKNAGAVKLYTSFGFKIVGQENFVLGQDIQLDYIMEKVLDK